MARPMNSNTFSAYLTRVMFFEHSMREEDPLREK